MLVSAVAEVDDRLIAEWDRSQNRTAAPLFEHGIGPSLYCSIKKPLVVQCLVARPPGPPYVLVVGDYFTKWVEAYPMPNMEAGTVAELFVSCFVCHFGVPDVLHTNQGRDFESALLKEVCQLLGVVKTRTTPYHPQSDGFVERFNRT